MKWIKVVAKGWSVGRSAGIGGVVAYFLTYALTSNYPNLAASQEQVMAALTLICVALAGSLQNYLKHAGKEAEKEASPPGAR